MNPKIAVMSGIAFLIGSLAYGADAANSAKQLTLLNASKLDETSVEEVRAFMQNDLRIPVGVRNISIKGTDPEMVIKELAAAKTENDVAVVGIVTIPATTNGFTGANKSLSAAWMNTSAIQSDNRGVYIARVTKLAYKGYCLAFGLAPDMDPHSAMHPIKTIEELDQLGLNLSPPWTEMVRKEAMQRGAERIRPPKRKPVK